jgi:hypothetical protein
MDGKDDLSLKKHSSKIQEKKDIAESILKKKKAPHKLMAEEMPADDNSSVKMTEKKMNELGIF